MSNKVLEKNDNLPIRTLGKIHSGKVRSVYWLSQEDSDILIEKNNYSIVKGTNLAIMVISDRISAFDCIWRGKFGGIPHKGLALNTISKYWFDLLEKSFGIKNHIVDIPHPYVWIVEKVSMIKIEFILRQYICGSMWRAYSKGQRNFCGNQIADGLENNQRLPELLFTPSTKGILHDIPGVPEYDDVNVSHDTILTYNNQFNLREKAEYKKIQNIAKSSFAHISKELTTIGQIFVDTKFEMGYNAQGEIILVDEIGTPDSSRFWDAGAYERGKIVENSKETLRNFLLENLDRDILLNKEKMLQRKQLAQNFVLSEKVVNEISVIYTQIAEKITSEKLSVVENPKEEILDLITKFGLLR